MAFIETPENIVFTHEINISQVLPQYQRGAEPADHPVRPMHPNRPKRIPIKRPVQPQMAYEPIPMGPQAEPAPMALPQGHQDQPGDTFIPEGGPSEPSPFDGMPDSLFGTRDEIRFTLDDEVDPGDN